MIAAAKYGTMVPMSTMFPRVGRSKPGYDVEQVERFLLEARASYDAPVQPDSRMTAESIRRAAFDLQKGGYATERVDAALERLEDAFASREKERALSESGTESWYSDARKLAQEVLDRLSRPEGHRFDHVGPASGGYHRGDVDEFADRLVSYFQNGVYLTVDEVRSATFRPQRGGYREAQVDLVLDAVVHVMTAVR